MHGFLAAVLFITAAFTASFVKMTQDVGGNFTPVVTVRSNKVLGVEAEAPQAILLVVNTGDQTIINSAIPIQAGDTVLSALSRAVVEAKIKIETKKYEFGTIVNQLGDKVGGTDGKYWLYSVNGQDANIGADQYKLEGGELISFRFATS